MTKFAIIICAFNKLQISMKCVESIRNNTEQGLYTIYFVDDGSTDGTQKYGMENNLLKDFVYIRNNKNVGYIKSATQGMNRAFNNNHPYLFFINNDVQLLSWWTEGALKLLADRKNAIIGALGKKGIAGTEINFISGSRLIIKRDIIEELGFYDLNLERGYWEDVELSWRVQENGYNIKKYDYFEESSNHMKGQTFKDDPDRRMCYNKNREYLDAKIRKYNEKYKHN